MSRGRAIPSLIQRSSNFVHLAYPKIEGVPKIRVNGAARLNDAFGGVAGVAGAGTSPMFEVTSEGSYRSPSVQGKRHGLLDENSRRLTRAFFDPDDFATPVVAAGVGNYLPKDDQTLFLRVQHYDPALGAWGPEGPILIVPPYDFMSTTTPVFTVTGQAPNLGIGAFPALPDVMPEACMSFLVPAFSATFSLANLADEGGVPIYFSCHPGMPPSVLKANHEVTLTGAGVPDVYVAAPNGNPWFTLRVAVVNSGA